MPNLREWARRAEGNFGQFRQMTIFASLSALFLATVNNNEVLQQWFPLQKTILLLILANIIAPVFGGQGEVAGEIGKRLEKAGARLGNLYDPGKGRYNDDGLFHNELVALIGGQEIYDLISRKLNGEISQEECRQRTNELINKNRRSPVVVNSF